MNWTGLPPTAAACRAWRALRDCGVIRATADRPGFVELFDRGLADYRRVADSDKLDWRLT